MRTLSLVRVHLVPALVDHNSDAAFLARDNVSILQDAPCGSGGATPPESGSATPPDCSLTCLQVSPGIMTKHDEKELQVNYHKISHCF